MVATEVQHKQLCRPIWEASASGAKRFDGKLPATDTERSRIARSIKTTSLTRAESNLPSAIIALQTAWSVRGDHRPLGGVEARGTVVDS